MVLLSQFIIAAYLLLSLTKQQERKQLAETFWALDRSLLVYDTGRSSA